MGLFRNINDYFTNKRLRRLEDDLMRLKNKMEFNPRYVQLFDNINIQEEFSKRISEYLVWFTGHPRLLRQFYQTNKFSPYEDLNYFWAKAPANYRKVHSGIPSLISSKMATILFGASYDIDVEIYKTNETGDVLDEIDKEASKQSVDMIKELLKEINFTAKLNEGAIAESWGGHVFYKLSYDVSLSQFPILEVVDIRSGSVVQERGITKAIIFKNWYPKGTKVYCHHEIYTTLEDGTSAIVNELYMMKADGELTQRKLTEIEETAHLEEIISFPGLTGLLAFEKPNKLPNNEFLDSPYGASDYSGAIPAFDALDEVLTEIIQEVRDNKTIRYIPASMIGYNLKGELAELNSFITNYVKIDAASQEERGNSEINITQISDKTLEHLEKWKVALTTAINKAGISPLALGITGLEAVNAGMESQRERNKATLETRSNKLQLWKPFIEKMILKILELNSWLQKHNLVKQKGFDKIDINFDNCNINVKFGDYIIESEEKLLEKWGNAKMQGIVSIETVVDMIHPNWSEERKREEVNRIRYENNLSLDTPETLQFSDLLKDYNEDDEEEINNE